MLVWTNPLPFALDAENLWLGLRLLAGLALVAALAEGRIPILCGGSGLYLRTLMQGIAPIPDAPPELREQANADWAALGAEAFRERLKAARQRVKSPLNVKHPPRR